MTLSIITPVYNEQANLEKRVPELICHLKKNQLLTDFDLIVVDNGSTDASHSVTVALNKTYPEVIPLKIAQKSFGQALHTGILNSQQECVAFQAADQSFGLNHISELVENYLSFDYDLVLGSKRHSQSTYRAPFVRQMYSSCCNSLLKLFFGIRVSDTQGTFLINKARLMGFLDKLDAEDAWFQAQLVIYAYQNGLKVNEIPVQYHANSRKSAFKTKDGLQFLRQIMIEYCKSNCLRVVL
ncbi:glycosyltransferase family 2 protein [Patescibacteria group bacterium]|nr:glycosyltransferase family 2 protein [Patescibacteria group bacterium]MBU1970376.1 glycosyltransferase family 2 protein [Patescibacteria group bacterium]